MAEPQKIVHIIGALGEFDASYNLRELARQQTSMGKNVWVIAFFATGTARRSIESAGVRCEVIRKRWGYDPFAARQLAQSLKEIQPGIVHLWGRRASDAAQVVQRAVCEAKLVASLVKVPQLRNPWWPNKSLELLDAIVVEREEVRGEFVDAGQGQAKVAVIPPGISLLQPKPRSRREILIDLALPTEARILTIAGPLERWQLVDEAIWAFELIRILHDHTHLVIVGDGPERARLERFTRQVTEPSVVRFVPRVEMLDDVLTHTEIFWQPGESETIPLAMLSAMAHGVSVVASDVSAHNAVISTEVNGFLVPTAKRAIWARHTDRLLRSADVRNKFAQAGKNTVRENYSLLSMTQAYGQLYQDLAAQKSRLCS